MLSFIWNSKTGEANMWLKRLKQWLPKGWGLTGKGNRRASRAAGNVLYLHVG